MWTVEARKRTRWIASVGKEVGAGDVIEGVFGGGGLLVVGSLHRLDHGGMVDRLEDQVRARLENNGDWSAAG